MALTELVDASLLEFSADYAPLSTIQEPKWRVRALLTKLESDRKNSTDFFSHKFMAKVQEIFSGLPKPKDVRSFEGNDLPLLFTANDVQQFALEHRLNKRLMRCPVESTRCCVFSQNHLLFLHEKTNQHSG